MSEIQNIDELIGKYLSGEASPGEAMQLQDWKDQSPENHLYFSQCEKMFFEQTEPDVRKAWANVQQQISGGKAKQTNSSGFYLRIAASVLVVIGLGIALNFWLNTGSQREFAYETKGASADVRLSDGTDVTISPNSSLVADKDFGDKQRLMHLKGSAYFSVVHNEEVPFVVEAGGVFIKDIGTRFLIRTSSDTDTVHVKVDEGVVLLFDDKNANVEIKAGGNAVYVRSTRQIISGETQQKATEPLNFSGNTLNEVIAKLNVIYKTRIELGNAALGKCTITTQFNNEKLETILSVITETLGLTYEKTETGYLIKGETCNQ